MNMYSYKEFNVKFSQSCPISFEKVDENIIRLQAMMISILGILYLFMANPLLLSILLYDFFIRIIGYKKISPSLFVANFIAKQFSMTKKTVDEGPKKFAAQIGLFFIIAANLFYYIDYIQLSYYTIAVLVFCAILESLLGFCVACQVYPLYRKLIYKE